MSGLTHTHTQRHEVGKLEGDVFVFGGIAEDWKGKWWMDMVKFHCLKYIW